MIFVVVDAGKSDGNGGEGDGNDDGFIVGCCHL